MTNFVDEWIRCNSCIQNFEKKEESSQVVSTFFATDILAYLKTQPGEKSNCPIFWCLVFNNFFKSNSSGWNSWIFWRYWINFEKASNIIKFQNQEKKLCEKVHSQINTLEEQIKELTQKKESLRRKKKDKIKNDCSIPDLIRKQIKNSTLRQSKKADGFEIQTELKIQKKKLKKLHWLQNYLHQH